jgi:soluble lytic murein transglycosylase-like protein
MTSSAKYQIPADLAASIYDIALSEGIDPALGFQLVKIESNFKANARSSMGAIGYTQLQVATARFYEPGVTERALTERDLNLRIGFRFLNDLLGKFDHDTHLALLAYNRGPAKVADILAKGDDPTNGYSDVVLEGYRPPSSAAPGWR